MLIFKRHYLKMEYLEVFEKNKHSQKVYVYLCNCGNIGLTTNTNNRIIKTCGKCHIHGFIGQKFKDLEIIDTLKVGKPKGIVKQIAVCKCGNLKLFPMNFHNNNYKNPATRCWGTKFDIPKYGKYFMGKLYGAISRCHQSLKTKDRESYQGRGIEVCERWKVPHGIGRLNYFIDMYENYILARKKHGSKIDIGRIDHDKGYSKANCIFQSRRENAQEIQKRKSFIFRAYQQGKLQWVKQK